MNAISKGEWILVAAMVILWLSPVDILTGMQLDDVIYLCIAIITAVHNLRGRITA